LAERLSQTGLPTLRFDYHGTGDSPGSDSDPDRVSTWLANVRAAVDWLNTRNGLQEIALVGLRLGALLAATVAAERGDIRHIALLAPVTSGIAYGREMRLLSKTLVPMGSGLVRETIPDAIEVAGFEITHRTLVELGALNLMSIDCASAARVLTLERDGCATEAAAACHLETLGVEITRSWFPGYQQMMVEPINSRPCTRAIEMVVDWLRTAKRAIGRAQSTQTVSTFIRDSDWIEDACQFGPQDRLIGVLCEPIKPASGRPCLVILGSGRDSHIGWARGSVLLARHLARHGIASLRFDLAGIGDSLSQPISRRAPLYTMKAKSSVTAAIDLVEARGYQSIALYGACSGAYLAFRVALIDPRVKAVAVRNIQRFVWRIDAFVGFSILSEPGNMLGKLLVSSGGQPGHILRTALKKVKYGLVRALGRVVALRNDSARVQKWITNFIDRNGRILIAFSANDSGRSHLDRILGRDGAAVRDCVGVAIHFIEGADHNFTGRCERSMFETLLTGFLLENSSQETGGTTRCAPVEVASLVQVAPTHLVYGPH
jgi:alpha-beta hydrolase superfamily lysophospholipase